MVGWWQSSGEISLITTEVEIMVPKYNIPRIRAVKTFITEGVGSGGGYHNVRTNLISKAP